MFRIEYEFHESDRVVSPGGLPEDATLREAIGDYRPRQSWLAFVVGGREINIDVGRSMVFLHEELMGLVENLAFEAPSNGPFLSQSGVFGKRERVYSAMLTLTHEPQYMFVSPRGEVVDMVTRTLRGEELVVASEYGDVDFPSACGKREFAAEIRAFVEQYFAVLGAVFPTVAQSEEYDDYLESLSFAAEAISSSVR